MKRNKEGKSNKEEEENLRLVKKVKEDKDNIDYTYIFESQICMLYDIVMVKHNNIIDFIYYMIMNLSFPKQSISSDQLIQLEKIHLDNERMIILNKVLDEGTHHEKYLEKILGYIDGMSLNFYRISTTSRQTNEMNLLNTMKYRVIGGDIIGFPLCLSLIDNSTKKKHLPIEFILPDYGKTFNEFDDRFTNSVKISSSCSSSISSSSSTTTTISTSSSNTDSSIDTVSMKYPSCCCSYVKDRLTLSVLSILSSLPINHKDGHKGNFCLFQPEILFNYEWNISFSNTIIKLSWQSFGMVTIIDWENYESLMKLDYMIDDQKYYDMQSKMIWKFDSDILKQLGLKVKDETFTVNNAETMKILLQGLFCNGTLTCPKNYCIVKLGELNPFINFMKQKEGGGEGIDDKVSSVVQIYPASFKSKSLESLQLKVKKMWKPIISKKGKQLSDSSLHGDDDSLDPDEKKGLKTKMDSLFHTFLKDYNSFFQIYDIPSDTGLVALVRFTNVLIALKDINIGSLITHLPFSRKQIFIDDDSLHFLLPGNFYGTIIKKSTPFAGFGGFTQWTSNFDEANCVINTFNPFNSITLVGLFAKRKIFKGEKIICFNFGLIKPFPTKIIVNDNFDLFKKKFFF